MARYLTLFLTLALLPGCNVLFWTDACRTDADCDDGDACTLDDCSVLTGACTNDPMECPGGVECNPDTGECAPPEDGDPTGASDLKRFESEEDLAGYFAGQITGRNSDLFALEDLAESMRAETDFEDVAVDESPIQDGGAAPPGGAAPSDDAAAGSDEASDSDSFSETTVQEEGVDEADVVKTDGTHLYVIHDALLRIVRVSPPEEMALLSQVSLEGYGREIYLHGSRVVALTEIYGGFFYGGGGLPEPDIDVMDPVGSLVEAALSGDSIVASEPSVLFERPQTIVTVIDVAVPDEPRILSRTSFDGSPASSRMIDGVLHLVLANYQNYYYDVVPMLGQRELDLSEVDVESLLPRFEQIDEEGLTSDGLMLTWENMFRPTDPDGFGVVTVVSMDVEAGSDFTSVGIVAEPGLIYSSLEALYLTDADYGFFSGSRATRQTTDIYKLKYVEGGTEPVATGTVPGRILNQYSMGEYHEHLRVATTVDAAFFEDFERTEPYNNVYVLGQVDTSLEIVGRIENIAVGEEIKSARFIGDRGYLVTFVRMDPLFTLNLADPTAPRVVGELKVPGFSTFIVPMDSEHLLTVGQYIPEDDLFGSRGVQLSIFDVSDFSNPELADNVIIGGDSGTYTEAYSEALGNPKAFTYFASAGLVALPISIYTYGRFIDDEFVEPVNDVPAVEADDDESGSPDIAPLDPVDTEDFEGLIVFPVSVEDGFGVPGRISTTFDQPLSWWTAFTRAVFIGDDVFAVTNEGVRGAPTADLESAPYELWFGSDGAFNGDEPTDDGVSISPGVE